MRRWTMAVVVLGLAQFCLLLGLRDINTSHEARVAQTAREMVQTGDWLVPQLQGQPRLQKPPLPYWCVAALFQLGGSSSAALARLPGALCGAVGTVLIIDLGRMLLGRRAGIVAGFIWISSHFVVDEFRKAMADPYLALLTLLAAWAWVRHDLLLRSARQRRFATILSVLVFWCVLGLGVLAKGPFILVHVGMFLAAYHLTLLRPPRAHAAHVPGLALFLLVALPWPLYIWMKLPDVAELWTLESLGEAAGARHPRPLWHYLAAMPLISLPWTPVAAWGLLWPFGAKARLARRARVAVCWLGLAVLVFSAADQKKNAYLLPEAAAITLLSAAPLSAWLRRRPDRRRIFIVVALMLAMLVHIVVAWIAPLRDNQRSPVPFVRQLEAMTDGQPLIAIGFVNEEVLFYLRRPVQFVDDTAELPADYAGFVLIGDALLRELEQSRPASRLLSSAHRSPQDRMYLLRIGPAVAQARPGTSG